MSTWFLLGTLEVPSQHLHVADPVFVQLVSSVAEIRLTLSTFHVWGRFDQDALCTLVLCPPSAHPHDAPKATETASVTVDSAKLGVFDVARVGGDQAWFDAWYEQCCGQARSAEGFGFVHGDLVIGLDADGVYGVHIMRDEGVASWVCVAIDNDESPIPADLHTRL